MIYVVIGLVTLLFVGITVIRNLKSSVDNILPQVGIVLGGALLAVLIAAIADGSTARVPEMLHYQYKSMTYYEPWNEYIHKTCSESHQRCSGSGKNRHCTTYYTYYDCSYVKNHSARWEGTTNVGGDVNVSESAFNEATSLWGNKQFIDMNRHYHTRDGDAYKTAMPDSANQPLSPRILGYSTQGSYKNKIVFSKSVFKFKTVTPEDVSAWGLYSWSENPLVGVNDSYAERVLRNTNYLYGASKQMSLRLMVFHNKGIESAFWQESYWNGGNKNEFNVCVGVYDDSIAWVKVISWTTNEMLKLEVRDSISSMGKFNAKQVAAYMATYVPPRFVRREFKEFEYLPDPPTGIWVYIVSILLIVGAFVGTFFINLSPTRFRY